MIMDDFIPDVEVVDISDWHLNSKGLCPEWLLRSLTIL